MLATSPQTAQTSGLSLQDPLSQRQGRRDDPNFNSIKHQITPPIPAGQLRFEFYRGSAA